MTRMITFVLHLFIEFNHDLTPVRTNYVINTSLFSQLCFDNNALCLLAIIIIVVIETVVKLSCLLLLRTVSDHVHTIYLYMSVTNHNMSPR